MTPFVDILASVVDEMKPELDPQGTSLTGDVLTLIACRAERLFVGEKIKLNHSIPLQTTYGKITTISEKYTESGADGLRSDVIVKLDASITGYVYNSVAVVLNYHHGHLLEVKNTFREYTTIAAVKREQFPAVVLVQDFPEEINNLTGELEVTCTVFLVTDSQKQYTAADRYDYTFRPILYPLYDLFFEQLRYSDYVADSQLTHTKIDRVFWGRESGEGSLSNIFNDFIDAIEISNLKVKILKTC